jgi:hypothetical protein
MSKLAWISLLAALATVPAIAETAIPDMKGTWTGESESIVLGRGNQHHRAKAATATAEPRLSSIKFTMVIDKQDGRRFGQGHRDGDRGDLPLRPDLAGRR